MGGRPHRGTGRFADDQIALLMIIVSGFWFSLIEFEHSDIEQAAAALGQTVSEFVIATVV